MSVLWRHLLVRTVISWWVVCVCPPPTTTTMVSNCSVLGNSSVSNNTITATTWLCVEAVAIATSSSLFPHVPWCLMFGNTPCHNNGWIEYQGKGKPTTSALSWFIMAPFFSDVLVSVLHNSAVTDKCSSYQSSKQQLDCFSLYPCIFCLIPYLVKYVFNPNLKTTSKQLSWFIVIFSVI